MLRQNILAFLDPNHCCLDEKGCRIDSENLHRIDGAGCIDVLSRISCSDRDGGNNLLFGCQMRPGVLCWDRVSVHCQCFYRLLL